MQTLKDVVLILAAITTAAAGGVYLGFSAMVMPALHGDPLATGVMNRINVRATRSVFMLVFVGSALTCLAAGLLVLGSLPGVDALLAIAGAAAGLVGFVITAAVNVPLNNRLAPASATDASAFASFEGGWRRANAARGWTSIAGAAALAAALVV